MMCCLVSTIRIFPPPSSFDLMIRLAACIDEREPGGNCASVTAARNDGTVVSTCRKPHFEEMML